jgi:hypothetical protein
MNLEQKQARQDKVMLIVVKSVFSLVLLAVLYYLCQDGVKGLEILGLILFVAGLAWFLGLGEKFYVVEGKGTMYNTAIGGAAVLLGAVLIWAA